MSEKVDYIDLFLSLDLSTIQCDSDEIKNQLISFRRDLSIDLVNEDVEIISDNSSIGSGYVGFNFTILNSKDDSIHEEYAISYDSITHGIFNFKKVSCKTPNY